MTTINSVEVYDQFANEYDAWFEKHLNFYQSELLASPRFLSSRIEIKNGS